jgi:hypothetical protein
MKVSEVGPLVPEPVESPEELAAEVEMESRGGLQKNYRLSNAVDLISQWGW